MSKKTLEFSKKFLALCQEYETYPIGGHDGEIYIGYDEESKQATYISWEHGEDEPLVKAKLRYLTEQTIETKQGFVTTVTPTRKELS